MKRGTAIFTVPMPDRPNLETWCPNPLQSFSYEKTAVGFLHSLTNWFATHPMFDESLQDAMEPDFLNQHSPTGIACKTYEQLQVMHVCTASCIYLWGARLRISNPQVIAGISTRRVGRKASIVESLGVFLGGSGSWVGCNHVCDAS